MKQLCFILLLLSYTITVSAQTVEEVLYVCLIDFFDEKGIDIDSELADFSNYLVENGQLENANGQGLYSFYEEIVRTKDISISIDTEQFLHLMDPSVFQYSRTPYCQQKLKNVGPSSLASSKVFDLNYELQEMYATTDISLHPGTIAEIILKVFEPSDLELNIYRANTLLIIFTTSNPDLITLPSSENLSSEQKESEVLEIDVPTFLISIKEGENFFVNGEVMSISEMENLLKQFLSSNPKEHLVKMDSSGDTAYRLYIEVLDGVMAVYKNIRDQKSEELFGKVFDELSDTEREKIVELVPKRMIIESND